MAHAVRSDPEMSRMPTLQYISAVLSSGIHLEKARILVRRQGLCRLTNDHDPAARSIGFQGRGSWCGLVGCKDCIGRPRWPSDKSRTPRAQALAGYLIHPTQQSTLTLSTSCDAPFQLRRTILVEKSRKWPYSKTTLVACIYLVELCSHEEDSEMWGSTEQPHPQLVCVCKFRQACMILTNRIRIQ